MNVLVTVLMLTVGVVDGWAQAPPPLSPAQDAAPGDYRVGAQDVLAITVFGEPQLSGKVHVDNDGTFSFRYLGRVKAADLTVAEIEVSLKQGLSDGYLRNPQVSVEIDQYHSQNVYVLGEVKAPAKYSLPGNSTLVDVLTQAGSVTASAGHWVLINHARRGGASVGPAIIEDAASADLKINLDDVQNGKAQNIKILDGDTIYVPKAEQIYVNGNVRMPGAYRYEENMTVFTAIALAGGVTEKGSTSRISVRRLVNGQMREVDVKQQDTLRPGDQVFVKPRRL